MRISFLHTNNPVRRSIPIELLVVADHKVIRAAIDWTTMEHFLGGTPIDEQAVSAFLRRNREGLEILIAAHLYAHGVPLARHLDLTLDELERLPAL